MLRVTKAQNPRSQTASKHRRAVL